MELISSILWTWMEPCSKWLQIWPSCFNTAQFMWVLGDWRKERRKKSKPIICSKLSYENYSSSKIQSNLGLSEFLFGIPHLPPWTWIKSLQRKHLFPLQKHRRGIYLPWFLQHFHHSFQFPCYTLCSIIFSSIFYWMSGMVPAIDAFGIYLLAAMLVMNVSVSIGYAFACIFGTVQMAHTFLPIYITPMFAFGG